MKEQDLKIQELTKELKETKQKLEYVKEYINKNCVYDNHLQGYCFDLPKGKVRTLMYKLNKK